MHLSLHSRNVAGPTPPEAGGDRADDSRSAVGHHPRHGSPEAGHLPRRASIIRAASNRDHRLSLSLQASMLPTVHAVGCLTKSLAAPSTRLPSPVFPTFTGASDPGTVVGRELVSLFLSGSVNASALTDVVWLYCSLPPAPWLSAWAACVSHHSAVVSRSVGVTVFVAFPLLLGGSILLQTDDHEATRRLSMFFSDICHSLSIVGTGALVTPYLLDHLSRTSFSAKYLGGDGDRFSWAPSWLLYALSHRLPPYVLLLAWLQMGFSAFGVLSPH